MDSILSDSIINQSTTCATSNALKGTRFDDDPYRSRRYCKWKVITDNKEQRWLARLISLLDVWEVKSSTN